MHDGDSQYLVFAVKSKLLVVKGHIEGAYQPVADYLTGVFMQGSDRWQPPEIPNSNEVLVRPEPIEEKLEQDQQAPEVLLDHSEAVLLSGAADDIVAKSAAAAADVDDREVKQSVEAQEETEKQHRHRHRSDTCRCAVCNLWAVSSDLFIMYVLTVMCSEQSHKL